MESSIPVPAGATRRRLLRLLDGRAPFTFFRAPAGYDAALTVQAWLHDDRRRLLSAQWVVLAGQQHVASVQLSSAWGRRRRGRIMVVDATASEREFDVEGMRSLAHEASRVIVLARSARVVPDHLPALLHARLITPRDLALTTAEVAELLDGADADAVNDVSARTSGWPVLVRLVASRENDSAHQSVASFADDLFARLSATAQSVVQAGSVIEESTSDLSAALTGLSPGEARLAWQEAAEAGLAVAGTRAGAERWKLVTALGEVVRSALAREHPLREADIHRRAARWFHENDQPLESIRHAVAGQDWDGAMEVLEASVNDLFMLMPAKVHEVLQQVPDIAFAGRDVSAVVHQLIAHGNMQEPQFLPLIDAGQGVATRALSDMAPAVVDHGPPWEITAREWRESIRARHRGAFDDALRFRAQFIDRVAETARPLEAATRAFLPMHYLQCGITSLLAGHFADAQRDFLEATLVGSGALASFVQRDAFGDLALLAAVEGDIPLAREYLIRMESRPRVMGYWRTAVQFGEFVATSLVATSTGNLEAAQKALDAAARTANRDELWAFYLLARARHAVAAGGELAALAEIARFRALHSHLAGNGSAAAFLVAAAEAALLLATDEAARAGTVLDEAPPSSFLAGLVALQRLQVGEYELAARLGGEALWADDAAVSSRALGGLARATALLRVGDADEAASSFRLAMGIMTRFDLTALARVVPRADLRELMNDADVPNDLADAPSLLPDPLPPTTLPPRERIVLAHLANGLGNAAIARALFVSENTVRSQVRSVYRKLGVGSREEAITEATRRGISL